MPAEIERVSQALAALPQAAWHAETDVLGSAAPLLADLKRINRDAYAHAAERRAQVASARERADERARTLAGWQYEARELRDRIDACGDLDPVYERVLDRTRTPGTEPPTEPAQVRAQLQAALDACRRWEQDVRALEAEAAELQKQSHASHRSLVRMEKDLSTLLQSVHKLQPPP
ncbi:Uncharacterized protein MSYG_1280 [Malassezia sympodialis ATCC 42132]|uniref:Uncharacterized protein n=1 Tax=Malassezia sympodialis (strain ATCC 42132) TaxID=1230383 RepID=A0A1M8A3F5_MALS4|nr:Uncharacterized protein MSYG_1280 [Malassezia sympodialis ATCC 42132]